MIRPGAAMLLSLLMVASACATTPIAWAQVTVDTNALDQLAPPHARPPAKPARRVIIKPRATKVVKPAVVKPAAPAKPAPPPVRSVPVPVAPPPPPVLPPPITVPTRPAPPPAAVSVLPDAPGEATPEKAGLRLTFGPQRADLNPTTDAALRKLLHDAPVGGLVTYNVTAYAAGNEDDPSTPRRISLARALAVRSVMITEGVPSIRIYVKALGAPQPATSGAVPDGSPDRVDIGVVAASAVPAPPPPLPSSAATPNLGAGPVAKLGAPP